MSLFKYFLIKNDAHETSTCFFSDKQEDKQKIEVT